MASGMDNKNEFELDNTNRWSLSPTKEKTTGKPFAP